MPTLRKDIEDAIIKLIDEGFKNVEISEKLAINRKTVAKRRRIHANNAEVAEQANRALHAMANQDLNKLRLSKSHADPLSAHAKKPRYRKRKLRYRTILKKDEKQGWKLEVFGDPTRVNEIVESLSPRTKQYLKKRLFFVSPLEEKARINRLMVKSIKFLIKKGEISLGEITG